VANFQAKTAVSPFSIHPGVSWESKGIKGVRVLWFVNHKSQFVFNKKPDRYKSARAFLFGGRGELVWRYNNLIYKLSWVQLLLVLQAMLLRFPT
jgi:hypothetical protein